ncbi:MAG TPA: cation transporter [Bdellovibrionales bacterium]|nr:MAG: hypothetical protein A2Z97_03490 [Bdellovibrionales bacterium GWB1_52_6]OFZ04040.1 MAG: hypothetical protein A2X97_14655 [Bdellovibrionales bacterium GWA1_52_35]HAR42232.1 cation transporter [Bdellovibrionales bacterium]HCM39875.1 cation transporter [Bdellovibrionales bacterium]
MLIAIFPGASLITTETKAVRHRAASVALLVTTVLTAIKFVVAFISGSVGVLSEAIHSLLDLISAGLSFFTVQHAIKPADEDHPFGHGKIETLSSLFETVLLLVAAGLIINEGIDQLRNPRELTYAWAAIAVILISLIASYWAYRHNLRAAQNTDSSALHVNALHFLSDVVASIGVLVGLILIKFTGWNIIDPVMAFLVAGYISFISIKQLIHALRELSDGPLPEAEMAQIHAIIHSYADKKSVGGFAMEAHDLRTRKSGAHRHIDYHLVVCGHMSVDESHAICDEMELKISQLLPNSTIQIHVEPCESDRQTCAAKDCSKISHVEWGTPRERGDIA